MPFSEIKYSEISLLYVTTQMTNKCLILLRVGSTEVILRRGSIKVVLMVSNGGLNSESKGQPDWLNFFGNNIPLLEKERGGVTNVTESVP